MIHDRFQWNIPEEDLGFISVEPEAGVLHPKENSVSHGNVPSTFNQVLPKCLNRFPESVDDLIEPLLDIAGPGLVL